MKPIDHLCYRVFGDDSRLGRLRKYLSYHSPEFVDDAIHDGIIAMVQECDESVFLMTQNQIFRTLTKYARQYRWRIQYYDLRCGLVAGSGKIKGQHFNYATSIFKDDRSIFEEDGSLKEIIENCRGHTSDPERTLIKEEIAQEDNITRKKAVARVLEIIHEIIGDVDIDDIVSVRDSYTTGRHGIGAGLAATLGVHERTMQRRLVLFKKCLSEDKILQQLLKEIL